MDLYELLTQMYLTIQEGCAVIPQVPILRSIDGKPWNACPDFLAINFDAKLLEIVEVNKSNALSKIRGLAERRLAMGHRDEIEHYVRTSTLSLQLDSFSVGWRFFVRDEGVVKAFKSFPVSLSYVESGGRLKVNSLREVFDSIRDLMP
jgi:hypothetical protein